MGVREDEGKRVRRTFVAIERGRGHKSRSQVDADSASACRGGNGAPGLVPVWHLLARDRARLFASVDFSTPVLRSCLVFLRADSSFTSLGRRCSSTRRGQNRTHNGRQVRTQSLGDGANGGRGLVWWC